MNATTHDAQLQAPRSYQLIQREVKKIKTEGIQRAKFSQSLRGLPSYTLSEAAKRLLSKSTSLSLKGITRFGEQMPLDRKANREKVVQRELVRLADMGFQKPELALAACNGNQEILDGAFQIARGSKSPIPSMELLVTLSACKHRHGDLRMGIKLLAECKVPLDYVRRVLWELEILKSSQLEKKASPADIEKFETEACSFLRFLSDLVGKRSTGLWLQGWRILTTVITDFNAVHPGEPCPGFGDIQKFCEALRASGYGAKTIFSLIIPATAIHSRATDDTAIKWALGFLSSDKISDNEKQTKEEIPPTDNKLPLTEDKKNPIWLGITDYTKAPQANERTTIISESEFSLQTDAFQVVKIRYIISGKTIFIQTIQFEWTVEKRERISQSAIDHQTWEERTLNLFTDWAKQQGFEELLLNTAHGIVSDRGVLPWTSVRNMMQIYALKPSELGFKLTGVEASAHQELREGLSRISSPHSDSFMKDRLFFWAKPLG